MFAESEIARVLLETVNPRTMTAQESTKYIMQIQNHPSTLTKLLHILQTPELIAAKTPAIVQIYVLISKHWNSIDVESKEAAKSIFPELLLGELSQSDRRILSEAAAELFDRLLNEDDTWNGMIQLVCQMFNSGNVDHTVLLLKDIILSLPAAFLREFLTAFTKMAQCGLESDSIAAVLDSMDVLFRLYTASQDIGLINDIVDLLFEYCVSSNTLENDQFNTVWKFASRLFEIPGISTEVLHNFFNCAMELSEDDTVDVSGRDTALYSVKKCISLIDSESAIAYVRQTIHLITLATKEYGVVPDSSLSIVEEVLSHRSHHAISKDLAELVVSEMSSIDSTEIAVRLSLFGPLIRHAHGVSYLFIDEFVSYLLQALQSEEHVIVDAAFSSIESFHDNFDDILKYSPRLLEAIVPHLGSDNTDVRTRAYTAFHSLLEICDYELNGLFEKVVSLQSTVPKEELANYNQVIALIIDKCDYMKDTMTQTVLSYTMGLINDEDENTKMSSLSLISALLDKEDSLFSVLFEPCMEFVVPSLASEVPELRNHALHFIRNTVLSYKTLVYDQLSPLIPFISNMVTKQRDENIVITAATIVRFCKDQTLKTSVLNATSELIKSGIQKEKQYAFRIISSLRGQYETSLSLFVDETAQYLSVSVDLDGICDALDALKRLYKYSKYNNDEENVCKMNHIVKAVFEGKIQFLEGTSLFEASPPTDFMIFFMDFMETYFSFFQEDLEEYFVFLFNASLQVDDLVAGAIYGSFVEAFKQNIPTDKCTQLTNSYIQHNLSESRSIVVKQNFIALLTGMLDKYQPTAAEMDTVAVMLMKLIQNTQNDELRNRKFVETIANCIVHLTALGYQHPDAFEVALQSFPPHDEKDLEDMATKILHVYSHQMREIKPESLIPAIGRLLSYSQMRLPFRKISHSSINEFQALFRTVCSTCPESPSIIQQFFGENTRKLSALMRILE